MERKKVLGVGVCDIPTVVPVESGRGPKDKCYSTWTGILARCHSVKTRKRQPTYGDCRVCDEWLIASNFKAWYDANYVDGWQIDKDYRGDGKLYSPETCTFVPPWLNLLMTDHGRARGTSKYQGGVR